MSLLAKVAELKEEMRWGAGARGPSGWEEKYITRPGETPWWEIEDPKERKEVQERQYKRMWRKLHPSAQVEANKRHEEKHPGAAAEATRRSMKRYPETLKRYREEHRDQYALASRRHREGHPEAAAEAAKRYEERHPGRSAESTRRCLERRYGPLYVGTPKAPNGEHYLSAPYKREQPDACELCGVLVKRLGWHHWDNHNASMGLWVCFGCNVFAEAADAGGRGLVRKYVAYRELLDEEYADGQIVEEARLNQQYRQLHTTIDGVHAQFRAWGKRNRPEDGLCELCGTVACSTYHHWDDSILGKGLWTCQRCDKFAERLDAYGEVFVEKYLSLKKQDELRVSEVRRN